MTTTDAAVNTGEGNALRIGDIVTINGKQYQVSRLQDSVWVKQANRNFAAQPVNKKTGKGWQAERLFMLGEIDVIDARRPGGVSAVVVPVVCSNKITAAPAQAAWYYKANNSGGFDVFNHDEKLIARMLEHYPNSSAPQWDARVLTDVSEAEAAAHVAMCIENDSIRAAHLALAEPLFDKTNWKLPTQRAIVDDLCQAASIKAALSYFCGNAEIRQLPNGKFSVGSLGYYNYVGA